MSDGTGIEERLFQALAADSGVKGLVGSRIWPVVSAEENPDGPFIAYRTLDGGNLEVSQGTLEDEQALIELRCVSASYAEAKSIARAVRRALRALTDLDCTVKAGEEIPAAGGTGDEGGVLFICPLLVNVWAN